MSETIYFYCPSCGCHVEVTPAADTIRPTRFEEGTKSLTCPVCTEKMIKSFSGDLFDLEYHLNEVRKAKEKLNEENAAELERMKHAVTIKNNEEEAD